MVFALVALGLIGCTAAAVTVLAWVTAPDGFEDDGGFHFAAPSVKLPRDPQVEAGAASSADLRPLAAA